MIERSYFNVVQGRASSRTDPAASSASPSTDYETLGKSLQPQLSNRVNCVRITWISAFEALLTQSCVSKDLLNVSIFPSHCGGLAIPNPKNRGSCCRHQMGVCGDRTQHDVVSTHLGFGWYLFLIQAHCGQRTLRFQFFEIYFMTQDGLPQQIFHTHLKSLRYPSVG